jgi:2,3-bisphosphoglycerate-dependent phosphoglycerate mutase
MGELLEPTRLIAIRHGETAWNVALRIQGQLDEPLNERGRWQAERLAEALAGESIDAIYASDLQRAAATAQALAARQGRAVMAEPALRERHFGHFEGLTHTEIEARWPEEARRWRQREPGFAPGGGETPEAFYARCVAAVQRIAEQHRGQTVAVVAHGGVLDSLYRAAVGVALDAPRSWQLGNATINRLLWHGEGFSLVGWNDAGHLDAEPAAERAPDSA